MPFLPSYLVTFTYPCVVRILILFFLLLVNPAISQPLQVKEALDNLQKHTSYKKATISLTLLDVKQGTTLLAYHSDTLLAPASTLKTFTSATALKVLGPKDRYATRIAFAGKISQGVGHGELRIYASGDPSFGSDRFPETTAELVKQHIAEALRKAGIRQFAGQIRVVGNVYTDEAIHPCWLPEDIGNYYGAGLYALNWKENKFELNLVPTKSSFAVSSNTAGYRPEDFCIELIHKEGASTEEAFAFVEKGKSCRYVLRGVLSTDQPTYNLQLARLNPEQDFVRELSAYLQKEFQFHTEPVKEYKTEQTLTTWYSPELSKLVFWCNQKSLNLYAEALCKKIAWKLFRSGNWKLGTAAMLRYASASGISVRGMELLDGSGLCENNRISTRLLAGMLRQYTRESFFNDFYTSLPSINGLAMKSGYIGGTRAYAGYIQLKDSTQACFSFIIHGYDCPPRDVKVAMFRILDILK